MKSFCIAALSAALLLAGCAKNLDTQEAVKAGVIKDLAKKVDVDKMDVNVVAVAFRGQEADATVSFSPKGAPAGQSITMKYAMAREGDEWKHKGRSLDGHSAPTAAPGGDLPAGHPGMGGGGGAGAAGARPPGHPTMGSGNSTSTVGPGGVPMPPAHPNTAPDTRRAHAMKVAILGGGPSGAFAAASLAAAGVSATVFDEKLAWEKPCGGGLTWKAWSQYPFLADNPAPRKVIHQTVLAAPNSKPVTLRLDNPLLIYSRFDLNNLLLERAQACGAQLEKTRVLSIGRKAAGWSLQTKQGAFDADYCIVATGARNPLRDYGTVLTAHDAMSALGYYVPADRERIDIQFLAGLEGYIWVFPRCGHLSVGICGKGEPAAALRARLDRYMDEQGLSRQGATFYSHLLPALNTRAWKGNRVAGDGWMAVGDAAGLVDPITGEGLYYAMRSADLAAASILSAWSAADSGAAAAAQYRKLIRRDFVADLEFGSRLAHRVFHGKFLLGAVTSRMVQFTRLSPKFRSVMQDLFAGTQPYVGLKRRLMRNLNGSLLEIVCNLGLGRVIPGRDAA